jgi:SAM-dependent methyltransferase
MAATSLARFARRVGGLPRRLLRRVSRTPGSPFAAAAAAACAADLRRRFAVYRTSALVGIEAAAFAHDIQSRLGVVDAVAEGYRAEDVDRQRDFSIKFRWGHDHDFGDFAVSGEMGERHLELMANFISLFGLSPAHFRDRDVLDVGCWTGGTTLLLAALGARVVALEEVRKYADTAQFLASSFGLGERVRVRPVSIYGCNTETFRDRFDVVYFPGVVYHLSDPLIALRLLYNALRIGGDILVESAGIDVDEAYCRFDGSGVVHKGTREDLNRAGWNWFMPSPSALARMMEEAGFADVRSLWHAPTGRVFAHGRKNAYVAICRAGLSVPDIP